MQTFHNLFFSESNTSEAFIPLKMSMNHDRIDFQIVTFWNCSVSSLRHSIASMKNLQLFLKHALDRPHFAHRATEKYAIEVNKMFVLIVCLFTTLRTVCANNFFRFCERSRNDLSILPVICFAIPF